LAEQDEEPLEPPPIDKATAQQKLRALHQAVTLFGETDWERYRRLVKCEENKEEVQKEQIKGNVYNDVLKMNEEQFKLHNLVQMYDVKQLSGCLQRIYADQKPVSHEEKCRDCLAWCQKMLKI